MSSMARRPLCHPTANPNSLPHLSPLSKPHHLLHSSLSPPPQLIPHHPSRRPHLPFPHQTSSNHPNSFSLLHPLSSTTTLHPTTPLNLLNYGITSLSSNSYIITNSTFFKKVAVVSNFTPNVPITVMGLTNDATKLLAWNYGDENWVQVSGNLRVYDDIVSHNGRFYATADERGRLVMIDHRLMVINVVRELMGGGGLCSYLVACEGGLYMIDNTLGIGAPVGVYKLDEKCRFWDYEFDLGGCVFFLADHVNYSVSMKENCGSVRDVIYFHYGVQDSDCVWDVKKVEVRKLVDDDGCRKLFWPPSKWFNGM